MVAKINIKLPEELKKQAQKYLGSGNYSEILRQSIQHEIDKRKEETKRFLYCFICDRILESKKDMNFLHWGESSNEDYLIVLVCDCCLNDIAQHSLEDYQRILKSNPTKQEGRKSFLHFLLSQSELGLQEEIAQIKQEKYFQINPIDVLERLIEFYPSKYSCDYGRFLIRKSALDSIEKDIDSCLKLITEEILSKK